MKIFLDDAPLCSVVSHRSLMVLWQCRDTWKAVNEFTSSLLSGVIWLLVVSQNLVCHSLANLAINSTLVHKKLVKF